MWKLAPLSFAFEIWCGELSSSSAVVTLLATLAGPKFSSSLMEKTCLVALLLQTKENSSSDDRSTTSLRQNMRICLSFVIFFFLRELEAVSDTASSSCQREFSNKRAERSPNIL